MDDLMKALGTLDKMAGELERSQINIRSQDRTGDYLLDSLRWPAGFDVADKKITTCAALSGRKGEIYENVRQQIRKKPELGRYLRETK